MSSEAGLVGTGCLAAYSASKGAVRLLTKDAAIEFAEQGVRVNSVHPGYIDTPMLHRAASRGPLTVSAMIKSVPLGKLGTADDVASLVVFLASDESHYCTGAEFVVDGGDSAR